MNCSCGKKVVAGFPYMAGPLCGDCFCGIIEQRVRRELKRVVENDRLLLVDDRTKEAAVLKFLMPGIIHRPAKLVIGRKRVKGYSKLAVNSCLDDIVIRRLSGFFAAPATGKKHKEEASGNHIFPLKHILEEEVELFARIKKLGYTEKRQRNKYQLQLKSGLDQFEKRFPGSKFSLLKSFEQLKDAA